MIGKPEWFTRRKYTGWGLSPATWQGWVYIIVMILPAPFFANVKVFDITHAVFLTVWILVFAVDLILIGFNMKKDEREMIHEAISERNALWAMLAVVVAGIIYQTYSSVSTIGVAKIDPIIVAALAAALLAKIISNIYLDRKD